MIEILSETALATVQDLGRRGGLGWGVGSAGAMDRLALIAGNLLLGNAADAAAIEVQMFPLALRFATATALAVTGAECGATLDGVALPPWWVVAVAAGQMLRLAPPPAGPRHGSRAYVCLGGGVDVPVVLGARATQLRGGFGGHQGRALRKGDRLPLGGPCPTPPAGGFGVVPPAKTLELRRGGLPAMRVLPAAEYHCYTPASRAALWDAEWRITPHSDRYGFRLAGPALEPVRPLELRSHGIMPGVIQVPHGGQPIVQMRDAQPSGGYPKIGTVIEADLWRLAQAPIGSRVRFIECDWDAALAAEAAVERWLAEVARLAGLYRQHVGGP